MSARIIRASVLVLSVLAACAYGLSISDLPKAATQLRNNRAEYAITEDGQVVRITPDMAGPLPTQAIPTGKTLTAGKGITDGNGGQPQPFALDEYNWTNLGCNYTRSGYNEVEPLTDVADHWSVPAGGAWTPWFGHMVEGDGYTVYQECADGYLYCRDSSDGSLVWSYPVAASWYYPGSAVIFNREGTPAVVSVTFSMSGDQNVAANCFDLATGSLLWSQEMPNNGAAAMFAAPMYMDGYIYAHTSGIWGGAAPIWKISASDGSYTTIVSDAGISIGNPCSDGQYLYVPAGVNGNIAKYDLNGNLQATSISFSKPPCGLAYREGKLYARLGDYSNMTIEIVRLNASDLSVEWQVPMPSNSGNTDVQGLTIDNENIYFCDQDDGNSDIFAIKQSDGSAAWPGGPQHPLVDGRLYDGDPAVVGEAGGAHYLYLAPGYYGPTAGALLVLNADDGSQVQYLNYSQYMFTGICRGNGHVYNKSGYEDYKAWSVTDLAQKENDIGVYAFLAPTSQSLAGGVTVTPSVKVVNYGVFAQASQWVYFTVDSSGTYVYSDSAMIPTIASLETLDVTMPTDWTPTENLWVCYTIRATTALVGDQRPANDFRQMLGIVTSDTIYSNRVATAPVLDGYMNPGEWDNAYYVNASNVFGWFGTVYGPRSAEFYLMHDNGYLYIAGAMPQALARNTDDQIGFYCDENNNQAWESNYSEGNYWFTVNSGGNDQVIYRAWTPSGYGPQGPCPGSQSASSVWNGYLVFEGRIPLGTLPYQLDVNPASDTCGVWLYGLDNSKWYGWWRSGLDPAFATDPAYYGTLILQTIQMGDVAATAVVSPPASVDTNAVVDQIGRFRNFGPDAMNFTAYYFLHDPTGARVDSKMEPVTLAPNATIDVNFGTFTTPLDTGTWSVRCSVVAGGDPNAANDFIDATFLVRFGPPPMPGWSYKATVPGATLIKYGAWLANDGEKTYVAKGNKSFEVYAYQADSFAPIAPLPAGTKPPKKGAKGIAVGENLLYHVRGSNTQDFFSFDGTAWVAETPVPLGPTNKKVKGGDDMVYVDMVDSGFVYLLKGYKNEFWKYNTLQKTWVQLPNAPAEKWKEGSWLVYNDGFIYAHQAKEHGFYKFDVATDAWSPTPLTGMPIPSGLTGKNKKSKDGGSAALLDGVIYALKGGNTQEFWSYTIGDTVTPGTWTELDTIPAVAPGTTKKKKVKVGGDIATAGSYFYAIKANKTNDFWMYQPITLFASRPNRDGVMAGVTPAGHSLVIGPNPLSTGYATVRYSVPKAGAVSLNVFDVTGRSVVTRTLSASRTGAVSLDLRSLSAGVYLVKLSGDGFSTSQKLVVER